MLGEVRKEKVLEGMRWWLSPDSEGGYRLAGRNAEWLSYNDQILPCQPGTQNKALWEEETCLSGTRKVSWRRGCLRWASGHGGRGHFRQKEPHEYGCTGRKVWDVWNSREIQADCSVEGYRAWREIK